MRIISVCGRKRSGKDSIAEYLIKNNNFKRYSFADPIKEGAMAMFGFTEAQMWGSTEDKETIDERWGISPRKMLQLMGTELFQYDIQKYMSEGEFPVGRKVWVQKFKLWYEEQDRGNIVIADVRFPHEANAIREMGGEIWRVERPSLTEVDEHVSEKEQDLIVADVTIINDGSLSELHNKIKDVVYMNSSPKFQIS